MKNKHNLDIKDLKTHKASSSNTIIQDLEDLPSKKQKKDSPRIENLYLGDRKFILITDQYNLSKTNTIYFCNDCLQSYDEEISYIRHKTKCTADIPGRRIVYKEGNLIVYKIFGYDNISYCQNLCILGKCFIKHKTLFWDVDNYNFYILYDQNKFIGFFSDEAYNESNNLSCILVLPDCQKNGYGTLLVDLSYKFKKGTCERPLSEEGEILFHKYWKFRVYKFLELNNRNDLSVNNIADSLNMLPNDVLLAFRLLNCKIDKNILNLKSINLPEMRRLKNECLV